MPTNKNTFKKQKSLRDFFSNRKQKSIATSIVAVVAVAGAYFIFFAQAAPNNCSPVEGGGICDVNQASSPDGADAVASTSEEVQVLATQHGWTDWGVPFRAPNFPQNGARPVHRYARADITAHFLVLEGTDDFNRMAADPASRYEGIAFYAWPDGSQPGTTPIHRINRKPLYFLQMYTDNQNALNSFVANPDGTWEDGGVNFWAYPAGYFPPKPAGTPTKDTDCPNQNLKLGDQGSCVQWHKGVINGYIKYNNGTGAPLDINNNTFDEATVNYTKLFATSLQSKGVKFTNFSGIVTKEVWDAFATGYPAIPPTPTALARPPVVPPNPGSRTSTPAPTQPTAQPPAEPSATDTVPVVDESDFNKGPNGCPVGQSRSARDGCVITNPTSRQPTPRPLPTPKKYVYNCGFAWKQTRTAYVPGFDNKSAEVKIDDKKRTASEAKTACETKLKTWKLDNKYFRLNKIGDIEKYETKDWQNKDVKDIKFTGIIQSK